MSGSASSTDLDALDSAHYLRAVADMAGSCAVTAQDAIYGHNGIKLVEKGTRIDPRLYDRLIEHKLREPIDSQLAVEGAVDVAGIVQLAERMVAERVLPRQLAAHLKTTTPLTAPLKRIPLPPPLAFKLTVMREQQPDLFEHSVEMTLVCLYLGLASGLDEGSCVSLAAAGLLHDVGTLHMDPAWRDPQHRMTGPERRHLVAHPVTSMLLLRDQQVYTQAVQTAVLEHHERMDGSGYPRGLKGAEISRLGRILLLAEVVSALFEKYGDSAAQRLSLILRLNHHKFDATLVGLLMAPLKAALEAGAPLDLDADLGRHAEILTGALERWSQLRAGVPLTELQEGTGSPAGLLDSRLSALSRSLAEAGSHPEQLAYLGSDELGEAVEAGLTLQEAIWELRGIHNICQRRWPELASSAAAGDVAVAGWCRWCAEQVGE